MKARKRITALILSLALLVTLMPQSAAQAATKTQTDTLLVGEVVNYTTYIGTIKSVSSNKKAVATVKKKDGKAVVTAKKAGKAVITIKTTRGTNKIKLTIKKASFSCNLKLLPEGYVLVSVKNNTSIYVDSATVAYTLKNPEGEIIKQETCTVSDLMPNKTAYEKVYYNDYSFTVSIENSSAKVQSHSRSLSYKYTSRVSATKITITEEDAASHNLSFKIQNTYSGSISGSVDFLFYDENGNIIDLISRSIYLQGKAIDSYSIYTPTEYASYKMVIRTYSKLYKKS